MTTKELLKNLDIKFSEFTIPDICKMIGKSNESVRKVLKDWGIKTKNILFLEENNVSTYSEKLKNYDYTRKSYCEISRELNIPESGVIRYFKENNIKKKKVYNSRGSQSRPPIEIPNELLQIIIGSMLGDGNISTYNRKDSGSKNNNSRLSITHSNTQRNYLLYKQSLLDKYVKTYYYKSVVIDERFKNPEYESNVVQTSQNIAFNRFKNDWYSKKSGNKDIIPYYVKCIEPIALAIWFMDDGSKEISGYAIHSMTFKKEYLYFLKGVLAAKFDLNVEIREKNTVYIGAHDVLKFNNLIEPYIHESLKYKLHSPNKIPLNGETPEKDNPVLNQSETIVNA